MAKLAQKQPFISSGEFVVRRAFIFDAVEYKSNDNFPHEEIGVDPRKLRNLFEAGYLLNKPDKVKPVTKKAIKVEEEEDLEDDTIDNEDAEEKDLEEESEETDIVKPRKLVLKPRKLVLKQSSKENDKSNLREEKAEARKARREARKAKLK